MKIRKLEIEDIDKGLLEVLAHLSKVEKIPIERYARIWSAYNENKSPYLAIVAEENGHIVGTATLIITWKLLRGGAKSGRISDVVTHQGWEGRGIGTQLVAYLIGVARTEGCYKLTLNCSVENANWYKRFGFRTHEVAMRLDL